MYLDGLFMMVMVLGDQPSSWYNRIDTMLLYRIHYSLRAHLHGHCIGISSQQLPAGVDPNVVLDEMSKRPPT